MDAAGRAHARVTAARGRRRVVGRRRGIQGRPPPFESLNGSATAPTGPHGAPPTTAATAATTALATAVLAGNYYRQILFCYRQILYHGQIQTHVTTEPSGEIEGRLP